MKRIIIGIAALAFMATAASAQLKRPNVNLPIDPLHLNTPQGTTTNALGENESALGNKILQALRKPFQDLSDFIQKDASAAFNLSTAIPTLQDGHGQQCWMAMGDFTAVLNAHPLPLTFHGMTDLEALRLANMAANKLCVNVHCTQVFSDLNNAVQQVAGSVGGVLTQGIQVPSLNALCSKVPQVAVIAPIADAKMPAQATVAPLAPSPDVTTPAIPASPAK